METQHTKSSKEKAAQKFLLKVPPAFQQDWEAALIEANEAFEKRPIDRKLMFIKKHSIASANGTLKISNKSRSLSSSNGIVVNELDDLDNQNDPFELSNK